MGQMVFECRLAKLPASSEIDTNIDWLKIQKQRIAKIQNNF